MDGSAGLTLLGDERGSVVAYANDNGRVEQINTYDGFGKQKPWNEGTFRYTGQTWLPELSLYYYKARLYDPDMGRFLQVDPIGYEDQMNLYAYVGNDPMNLVDPTGEMGWFTDFAGFFGNIYQSSRNDVINAEPDSLSDGFALVSANQDLTFSAPGIAGGTALDAYPEAMAYNLAGAGVGKVASAVFGQLASPALRTALEAAKASGSSRGAAAGLITRDGQVFSGLSTRADGPGRATNEQVQAALNNVPITPGARSPFHGKCCEINALSNALNAGADVRGGTIAAVNAGGRHRGALKAPCTSCSAVLRQFDVQPIMPR